jgi:hypothetical protein
MSRYYDNTSNWEIDPSFSVDDNGVPVQAFESDETDSTGDSVGGVVVAELEVDEESDASNQALAPTVMGADESVFVNLAAPDDRSENTDDSYDSTYSDDSHEDGALDISVSSSSTSTFMHRLMLRRRNRYDYPCNSFHSGENHSLASSEEEGHQSQSGSAKKAVAFLTPRTMRIMVSEDPLDLGAGARAAFKKDEDDDEELEPLSPPAPSETMRTRNPMTPGKLAASLAARIGLTTPVDKSSPPKPSTVRFQVKKDGKGEEHEMKPLTPSPLSAVTNARRIKTPSKSAKTISRTGGGNRGPRGTSQRSSFRYW